MFTTVSSFKQSAPQHTLFYRRKAAESQRLHTSTLFAGSCCGGNNKGASVSSPPPAPSSEHQVIQPSATSEPAKSATTVTHSAVQKPAFWQTMRTQIAEWFRQFFSILKIDLKALLTGKNHTKS